MKVAASSWLFIIPRVAAISWLITMPGGIAASSGVVIIPEGSN